MSLAVAAALVAASASTSTASAPTNVRVSPAGQEFVADFTLPRSAPAWGFFRSSPSADGSGSWRAGSWTVLTPGVRLVRRGRYDALVGSGGRAVPRKVRVRFRPYTGEIASDYLAALRLGQHGVAVFDGHFALFSVGGERRLAELPSDLEGATIDDSGTAVRFTGSGLRLAGDLAGYASGNSAGTYGLYHVPAAVSADGMATVVDPAIPAWLAEDIRRFTPLTLQRYARLLGPLRDLRPTVLASWAGADGPGASINGGALVGLVLLRISGQKTLTDSPVVRSLARTLIAHESAHFWLGQQIDSAARRDHWMIEGGADLLAHRALEAIDPQSPAARPLQRSLDSCIASSSRGALSQAPDRGDHQAFYQCGAILSLVAERAAGGDFHSFVRALIAANRDDRKLSRAEWLAEVERRRPGLRGVITALLDNPATAADWTALLRRANVPLRSGPDGKPVLQ